MREGVVRRTVPGRGALESLELLLGPSSSSEVRTAWVNRENRSPASVRRSLRLPILSIEAAIQLALQGLDLWLRADWVREGGLSGPGEAFLASHLVQNRRFVAIP